ncbi:hypothetical protein [Spirosoma aerolatum]|uniref:hypothetical protein n=1 Tax=Spirosoma aerolatum TaxID=1211326 RepID=UPI001FEA9EB2|nr:hypothetical protein [Spirosoma aerolatum]
MSQMLHAGPVQVRYEQGFLRYFTHTDTEILRLIYFAIRDHNWTTAAFTITNESITQQTDTFRVQYNWQIDDLGIQMTGNVVMLGDEKGRISVDFYGKALNSFRKNRIGLCILHPIDGVLGQPAQVVAPDGTTTDAHFPTFIKPHQPFLNVQTLRWKPASGLTWQLDVAGDVFETEDQRNWSDASFKTYSTPQVRPKPVTVSAGDEFQQKVILSLAEEELTAPANDEKLREMEEFAVSTKLTQPRIGVGYRTGGPALTDAEVTLLGQLNLSHLRVEVFFSLTNWQELLAQALADANRLAIPLELALFFGTEPAAELTAFQQVVETQAVDIQTILLFDAATLRTSDELLAAVVPILRNTWSEAAIGGGTDDNFAELNRNPFDFEQVDFVTYSVSPLVHALDDLTLFENLAGQAETVLSARKLSGGKPVHISPITFRLRFKTLEGTATERLNAPADLRQTTEFGADWTRQSLGTLAKAGIESVTYYQTHGPGGLVSGDMTHPVYHVFKQRLS